MFEMKLSDLASALKEQVIPRGQHNEKALYMCFDVGLRIYSPIEAHCRSLVHILMYCPYGGSVHTFVAEQDFGPTKSPKELVWENTSNHDSCWRSDGLDTPLSRIYFRMADEINAKREAAGYETMAPVQMSQSCHFHMFGDTWRLVDVKLSREDQKTYRHTIEILSEV